MKLGRSSPLRKDSVEISSLHRMEPCCHPFRSSECYLLCLLDLSPLEGAGMGGKSPIPRHFHLWRWTPGVLSSDLVLSGHPTTMDHPGMFVGDTNIFSRRGISSRNFTAPD
jgi:hypothetical protein